MASVSTTTAEQQEREQKRIHCATAKYLYEKWKENRMLYDEQIRTGKDHGIYYSTTKKLHPKFKHFTPLNLERYVRDWEMEHGVERNDGNDNGEGGDTQPQQQEQAQKQHKQNGGKENSQSKTGVTTKGTAGTSAGTTKGKKSGTSGKSNSSRKGHASKTGGNDYDDFEDFERSK